VEYQAAVIFLGNFEAHKLPSIIWERSKNKKEVKNEEVQNIRNYLTFHTFLKDTFF
jgi:hypothetical protein